MAMAAVVWFAGAERAGAEHVGAAGAGHGEDDSKLAKEWIEPSPRGFSQARRKQCCGYPLSEELGFKLRFYWVAFQDPVPAEHDEVDLYTREGFFLGAFPHSYVRELRMEGSGILADGRVVNYAGRCSYGIGTCYEQLDPEQYPVGRGAGLRALRPFKSVAVDPRVIPFGEPLYVPEFDGLLLPDGEIHDGCVRADDAGGAIKENKIDFFVVSWENFRFLLRNLFGTIYITPHIEAPRCKYLAEER